MSNADHKSPECRVPDLLIRADRACTACGSGGTQPQILAPWLNRLPVTHRDLLSILPVLDINGALFADLDSTPASKGVALSASNMQIAALLCVDPFLRLRDATRLLRTAGITAVTNFPTVQVVDGTAARGFESADLGVEREAAILHQFMQEGFAVTGFATSTDNALRLMALGIRDLIIHPGPPSSDWRNRATAAQTAATIVTALRTYAPASLRLFCPDEYGHELDPARDRADGLVRYG